MGGGAKSLNFRGAGSLKGGEIPGDLAPGRAKSLGISPRGGQIPGGGRNPCDTGTPDWRLVPQAQSKTNRWA